MIAGWVSASMKSYENGQFGFIGSDVCPKVSDKEDNSSHRCRGEAYQLLEVLPAIVSLIPSTGSLTIFVASFSVLDGSLSGAPFEGDCDVGGNHGGVGGNCGGTKVHPDGEACFGFRSCAVLGSI